MPRLAKYQTSVPQLSKPLQEIDDNYLRAIEYGSFSYLVNAYAPKKSNLHKSLLLSIVIVSYEGLLKSQFAPASTKVKANSSIPSNNKK